MKVHINLFNVENNKLPELRHFHTLSKCISYIIKSKLNETVYYSYIY